MFQHQGLESPASWWVRDHRHAHAPRHMSCDMYGHSKCNCKPRVGVNITQSRHVIKATLHGKSNNSTTHRDDFVLSAQTTIRKNMLLGLQAASTTSTIDNTQMAQSRHGALTCNRGWGGFALSKCVAFVFFFLLAGHRLNMNHAVPLFVDLSIRDVRPLSARNIVLDNQIEYLR